jgi:hypothetical protein
MNQVRNFVETFSVLARDKFGLGSADAKWV